MAPSDYLIITKNSPKNQNQINKINQPSTYLLVRGIEQNLKNAINKSTSKNKMGLHYLLNLQSASCMTGSALKPENIVRIQRTTSS